MDPRAIDDAAIDVCPTCSGLWVDWFDGELRTVAVSVGDLAIPTAPFDAHPEGCPRCRRPLAPERWGRDEVELLRCAECAGAFVPRASLDALAASRPDEEPDSAWQRLFAIIRRLFAIGNED
jgi:Zn-finger nucleic acid-binding protein